MADDALEILRRLDATLARAMKKGLGAEGLQFTIDGVDPDDRELAAIADRLSTLFAMLNEANRYAAQLAEGNLDASASRANIFIMPLKALQSSLRHLTWQAGQVASGDLNQQVYFLGDFSSSFNRMIAALREKQRLEDHLHTMNQTLEKQAATDSLTGIANRLKLAERLGAEMDRARRYALPLTIILLDVDHFKKVNDSFGHLTGDAVLQELARLIEGQLRAIDILARWGGEEFMVVLPNCDLDAAGHCAEKLRRSIAEHHFSSPDPVTASFGITALRAGDSRESLTKRADDALYVAKQNGRNQVKRG